MILENVLWMLKCLGVFDGKFILSYNIVGIVYQIYFIKEFFVIEMEFRLFLYGDFIVVCLEF